MQRFNLIFLIILFSSFALCQSEKPNTNECYIFVTEYKTAKSLNSEKPESKGKVIGTFLTDVHKSESTKKTFLIPRTKLFVHAEVLYDDNIYFKGEWHNGISMILTLSHHQKMSLSSSITHGISKAQYDENFKKLSLLTTAHVEKKWFDVSITCSKK